MLSTYVPSFSLLRDFDEGNIIASPNTAPDWSLTLEGARDIIRRVAQRFPNDQLFGNEHGDGLDGHQRTVNNALAAITLLVAMSDPTEKDLMIALIIRMIVPETY